MTCDPSPDGVNAVCLWVHGDGAGAEGIHGMAMTAADSKILLFYSYATLKLFAAFFDVCCIL